MKSNTNTKAKSSKKIYTKGLAPSPTKEKKSGLNIALPLVELTKDPNADKESASIKIHIENTISNENKKNYDTKSFKVIETFGYNGTSVFEMLRVIDPDIFTPYALKGPLLIEK